MKKYIVRYIPTAEPVEVTYYTKEAALAFISRLSRVARKSAFRSSSIMLYESK